MGLKGLVAIDGQISPLAEAKISVLDRGLLYADSVFEMVLAVGKKTVALSRHYHRLIASAERYGIAVPWSESQIRFEIEALLEQASLPRAAVRILVTRGDAEQLLPARSATSRRIIYVTEIREPASNIVAEGIKLQIVPDPRLVREAHVKAPAEYGERLGKTLQAADSGFHDVLWLNSNGEVTETTSANIFFVGRIGDALEIVTPPPSSGLLPGVTRKVMLELMAHAKIRADEAVVFRDEIPKYDEAFICSSLRGLVPVAQIDKHKLQTNRPGATWLHLQRLYAAWLKSETDEDTTGRGVSH